MQFAISRSTAQRKALRTRYYSSITSSCFLLDDLSYFLFLFAFCSLILSGIGVSAITVNIHGGSQSSHLRDPTSDVSDAFSLCGGGVVTGARQRRCAEHIKSLGGRVSLSASLRRLFDVWLSARDSSCARYYASISMRLIPGPLSTRARVCPRCQPRLGLIFATASRRRSLRSHRLSLPVPVAAGPRLAHS